MATYKITDIEGIGPVYAEKLKSINIHTVNTLLERGCTKTDRKEIATATGISENLILSWVNFADLYRIKGVGSEYSQLLEKAGVDSVKELRNRKPENLHAKLVETNESHNLVRQLPGLKQVESWIKEAKNLKPMITY